MELKTGERCNENYKHGLRVDLRKMVPKEVGVRVSEGRALGKVIQAGRDLKRDGAYGKEGRGLWKKSSIVEKVGSKVLAWGGAWLWKELLEGLCGKWNYVTSQHNLEGEGGLRGILEDGYMLEKDWSHP